MQQRFSTENGARLQARLFSKVSCLTKAARQAADVGVVIGSRWQERMQVHHSQFADVVAAGTVMETSMSTTHIINDSELMAHQRVPGHINAKPVSSVVPLGFLDL